MVREVFPQVEDDQLDVEFEWLEIDSFDLVTLRVSLEQALGAIPDVTWMSFRRLRDVIDHYSTNRGHA